MQVGSHNIAYVLLHDMLGFGWPIFGVILLIGIRTLVAPSDGEARSQRILLIGGGIALFCSLLFLLIDGSQIMVLAGKKPTWGMLFFLAIASASTGALLSYRKRRKEAIQMARGLFEADAATRDVTWQQPRIFIFAGALLFLISLTWLVILSSGPLF